MVGCEVWSARVRSGDVGWEMESTVFGTLEATRGRRARTSRIRSARSRPHRYGFLA